MADTAAVGRLPGARAVTVHDRFAELEGEGQQIEPLGLEGLGLDDLVEHALRAGAHRIGHAPTLGDEYLERKGGQLAAAHGDDDLVRPGGLEVELQQVHHHVRSPAVRVLR